LANRYDPDADSEHAVHHGHAVIVTETSDVTELVE